MKQIVVYFSRAGQNSVQDKLEVIEKGFTQVFAEKIAHYAKAHIFKLDPVVTIRSSLDKNNLTNLDKLAKALVK